jgi:predicted nuclease with RNAse H fold
MSDAHRSADFALAVLAHATIMFFCSAESAKFHCELAMPLAAIN